MPELSSNNKRIAKNTLMLYCRTLLVMLVTLYTSRVVLRVLGVEDYGIYNVVGGIVVMFSFITSTLSSASQRYIAYEIPRNNEKRLKETFSLIMLSYGIVALITFFLTEILGVWFLNKYMNIPESRMFAANCVLQTAIVSFILNIFTAPYMAVFIAHERMNVYAYISIVDAFLKLIIAYLLQIVFFDSLIAYSLLTLICTLLITLIYRYYCKRHYPESRYSFFYDKERLKNIISYTWWSMFGPIANVIRGQGVNILLNLFFGPSINAARAIAYQVNSAINTYSSNFYTALRPQIVKSNSIGDVDRMKSLIISSSRLSFCLLLLISMPVYFNVERLLNIWLVNYPDYSVIFIKIILISSLLEVFNNPLVAGLIATGNIKAHQLIIGLIYILNLPFSYVILKLGYGPECTFYLSLLLMAFALVPRLCLCKRYYKLNVISYVTSVLIRCLFVAYLSYVTCNNLLKLWGDIMEDGIALMFLNIISVVLIVLIFEYVFGVSQRERTLFHDYILKLFK